MASLSTSLKITQAQFVNATEMLSQFVAIPSVSNPGSPDYKIEHLRDAAFFAGSRLQALGLDVRYETLQENTAPFILAQKIVDPAKKTLLLYAHYDVQPVDREKWHTDPFKLTEKEGRLYGRGASDDKAGVVAILTALNAFEQAGQQLPVNLKILIEGEEEYGSTGMSDLLKKEIGNLQADALVILDGGNRDVETGTIENSTRGVVSFELDVHALDKPVHSGTGCLVPDPIQALAQAIVSVQDPKQIPGLLDDCVHLTDRERQLLAAGSSSEKEYREENGLIEGGVLRGDPRVSIYERIVEEPSISVLNITSGKKGGGNSIQSSAHCTLGVRLTPGQDPDRVSAIMIRHLLNQRLPFGLKLDVKRAGLAARAWKADLSGPIATAYLHVLKENYPQAAVMPTGGTLPLIEEFERAFPKMEMVIAGVEDPQTAAHSHNESQDKKVFERATNSLIGLMARVGEMV